MTNSGVADSGPSGCIQPWPENTWYWAHRGQPVLLLGGSDDDNLFQWPAETLIPQLDRIVQAGGNLVRNTMSDRRDGGWELYPFLQLPDGRYDLSQWNENYWERFEFFLEQTALRRIFVQIEVWDRFDYTDVGRSGHWQRHPYNPVNNISYTQEETGLRDHYPDHPNANKQPFFFSTPGQRHIVPLLNVQRAFVDRLLSVSLKYDHVLYCIDNETSADPAWGRYWAEFIRERAKEAGRTVSITEMWDDWDLRADRHRQTFDHPELYNFVDVSQNNHNSGRKHWDNFAYVRQYLSSQPRPINTIKTYGADRNKFGHSDQDAIERFWRHLLGGAAAIRFHRPDSGLGINDKAMACLRAARRLEASVPIWNLQPAMERLTECEPNECYAASTDNDSTVVLYFPASDQPRSVRWMTTDPQEEYSWSLLWLDIDQGRALAPERLEGTLVQPPEGLGNVAAVLRRDNRPMLPGELVQIGEHRAFIFLPDECLRKQPQPWVLYAPTLLPDYPDEHERWMHQQFLEAGVAVAGVDVGEAYGSPECVQAMDMLYEQLVSHRGFDRRPVALGRSRGGLWVLNWAANDPRRAAGLAGIYPVFDLRSYPGLDIAAESYRMSREELETALETLNPIDRSDVIADAALPVFIIHGALDQLVPLDINSGELERRYEMAESTSVFQLQVIADQGHNYWPGFFRSRELVDFVIRQAKNQEISDRLPN